MLLSEFVTSPSLAAPIDVRGLTWWGDGSGFSAYLSPNSNLPDVYAQANYCRDEPQNNLPSARATSDGEMAVMYGARSRHIGGVSVGMCDGSIRFVTDEVDLNLWRALSTINGGEVIYQAY